MKYPFEVPFSEIEADPDEYVSALFASLESEFLVLPKGPGFIEYADFERAYEILKRATGAFTVINPETLLDAVLEAPLCLVVLRTILGLTPSEWAYLAARMTGKKITQGHVRNLDRKIRLAPFSPLRPSQEVRHYLEGLIQTACRLLLEPAPDVQAGQIHRLDKADTRDGIQSLKNLAGMGVPYPMLLYERLLGRPFAGHRDSVSELVGGGLETAIENILSGAGISYRKTKRAEKIHGFDQAPDFIVPDEFDPQVVIEAKLTEDDGTARDKVTRVQHLATLALSGQPEGPPRFEVIACIGGRGFAVRREDMKKLLLATQGKVFTLKTLDRLVDCSRLKDFQSSKA